MTETIPHINAESRRHFLLKFSGLCIGGLFSPAVRIFANNADLPVQAAMQWRRIRRGLPPQTLAACERIANKLAPQATSFLSASQWESRTYKTIIAELKSAGLYPESEPAKSKSKEAERLRPEAADRDATSSAASASIKTASATVAAIPTVGPVIAAVLTVIAAVIILLGEIVAKTSEDEAATKEERSEAADKLKKVRKIESDLVKLIEPLDDCKLFGKNCK